MSRVMGLESGMVYGGEHGLRVFSPTCEQGSRYINIGGCEQSVHRRRVVNRG